MPAPAGPTVLHPMPEQPRVVLLRPLVKSPLIEVGDYSYYDDPEDATAFETRNVLHHYGPEKLIIGKCHPEVWAVGGPAGVCPGRTAESRGGQAAESVRRSVNCTTSSTTPVNTITRVAASSPFQVFDCHMENHSPPIAMNPAPKSSRSISRP